jgi:S-formylglutathione hydrolase FrmB
VGPTATIRPQSTLGTSTQPADDGARVIEIKTIDSRLRDLTIDSPAVGRQVVRVLLPVAFDTDPAMRWPVLYLLSGADGTYQEWTESTDVEALTADARVIVVMPEAGQWGWYSDWWNQGKGGAPMWETFHLTEIREILERNWHAGTVRALAGASMGGYGAMEYASREPNLFVAAASFSGVLDPLGAGAFTPSTNVWGDPIAQADIWRAHDPIEHLAALTGHVLFVSFGDGQPGPFDGGKVPDGDLEAWVAGQDADFVQRLKDLHIAATVDRYAGTHTARYFERELHLAMPLLLGALGEAR